MKRLFGALLLILLTGCSTNVVMRGHQVSNVDAQINISTSSRIRIEAQTSDDSLTNKRYLDQVRQAFQSKGFYQVGVNLNNPDFIARYDLSSQSRVREFQEPIYAERRSGHSTHCTEDKEGHRRCTHNVHYTPYLAGYETRRINVLEAKMSLDLLTPDNKVVFHSDSTVEQPDCSRWKLYEFLVSHTIKHLDLTTPLDQPYSVEMPDSYQCQDDR